jgi:hypothetical protein
MSYRSIIALAVATTVGVACVSTDALAHRGVYRGGVYRGA